MENITGYLLDSVNGQLQAFLSMELALMGSVGAIVYHWMFKRPNLLIVIYVVPLTLVCLSIYQSLNQYKQLQESIAGYVNLNGFIRDHINTYQYFKVGMIASSILLIVATTWLVTFLEKNRKEMENEDEE